MRREDPYELPDETWNRRSYNEFKLDKIDEDNLKEIENNLKNGLITSSNKDFIIDYLDRLYKKIKGVKQAEFAYEGDDNLNVNMYLVRIRTLMQKIMEL